MPTDAQPNWRERRIRKGRQLGSLPRSRGVERWYDRLWLVVQSFGKWGIAIVVGLLAGAVAASAVAVWTVLNIDTKYLPGDLPETANPTVSARPSKLFDVNGNQIAIFREFDLTRPVGRDDVPQVMKEAVVAAEDRRFFDHRGVDLLGVARAALENYQEGDVVQGGSTITQQYVKNAFTTGERTYERKLNEALMSMQLEARLEDELGSTVYKDEILFLYLDTAYFGDGLYGIGAAAESWFGKNVSDLHLSEAALIAGVIRSPSRNAPRTNAMKAEAERKRVLQQMLTEDFITQAQYEEAIELEVRLVSEGFEWEPATWVHPPPVQGASAYPYFVDFARQYLEDRYGHDALYRGGLQVTTTLDPAVQQLALDTVGEAMEGTESPLEMSLVSIDPRTGHVRALVGGRDFNASQVNLATGGTTGFQPGSSFKPFTLATALERGATPDTVYSSPGTWVIPNCTGRDCDVRGGNSAGRLTLREATARSTNTVFAQVAYDVGPDNVAEMANRLGVTRIKPRDDNYYGVSITLGAYEASPLDMASGFATFAASGRHRDPTPVLRVEDEAGNLIEDNAAPAGERVLDAAIADTVSDILTGVIAGGTGRRAEIGRPAAGKTGTAQLNRAAWFVGYTPQLATAVWIGHSDGARTVRLPAWGTMEGGELPARTWGRFMSAALEGEPELEFPEPGELPPPITEFTDKAVSGSGGVATRGIGVGGRRLPAGIGNGCGGQCVDALPPGSRNTTTILPPRVFDPLAVTTTTEPTPTTEPPTTTTSEPENTTSTSAPTTTTTTPP